MIVFRNIGIWSLAIVLGLFLLGTGGAWPEASCAQLRDRAVPVPPSSSSSDEEGRPSFGRLLGGSVFGVTIGAGAGLLLLRASSEANPDRDRHVREDDPESEAAATMVMVGLAAIVAGGPVGAVEVGGIERRRRDAYVRAGLGEVVTGVLGVALAGALHDSRTARVVGLGVGAATGSAVGAYWIASQKKQRGLFGYREGQWHITPPDVRVRPHLATDRGPSVDVALVSIQL